MPATSALSFQLYSARNFPPLDAQLALLARLGYRQVEPFGGLYADLDALAEGLARHRLAAPSGHFDLAMLENDIDRTLAIAERLGTRLVIAPFLPQNARPDSAAGWRALGERLARVRAHLASAGLAFAWHNHDFELRALPDGATPLEALFAADPGLQWEADIGWIVRAGANPVDWLTRHGARISAIHIKDVAPAGSAPDEDGWADIGTGVMDWPAVVAAARASAARLLVVEHDKPSDLERCAAAAISAVQSWPSF